MADAGKSTERNDGSEGKGGRVWPEAPAHALSGFWGCEAMARAEVVPTVLEDDGLRQKQNAQGKRGSVNDGMTE